MHDRSTVAVAAAEDPLGDAALSRFTDELARHGVLTLHLGPVAGDGWLHLPAVGDELEDWHARLAAAQDRRVAAATLASWVVAAPTLTVALPALFARVLPRIELEDLAIGRDESGVVTGYALTAPVTRQVDGDVLDAAADTIAHLVAPLVAVLRAALPVGRPATWGAATDAIASYALWFARLSGAEERAVWGRADQLIGRLTERLAIRPRPRLFPVTWSGGTSHFPVRGTCCLWYRTCGGEARGEDRYCATCPLRSDASRTAALTAHLEATP